MVLDRTRHHAIDSLHVSVQFGTTADVLKYLDHLQRTGSPEQVNSFDDNGWAPIHLAAGREGYISQLLVDHGADVTLATRDEAQETALHLSVRFGGTSTAGNDNSILSKIDALLESGADPNARSGSGDTALHWAARAGDVHVTLQLLEAGADPSVQEYRSGRTPCHEAAIHGHPHILEEITRRQRDIEGESPEAKISTIEPDCFGARDQSGKTAQDYTTLRRERRKEGQRTAESNANTTSVNPSPEYTKATLINIDNSEKSQRYTWLQELQLQNFAEVLEQLGVDTPDDMAFLSEKDLTDKVHGAGMPLVKARKLLAFGAARSRGEEL